MFEKFRASRAAKVAAAAEQQKTLAVQHVLRNWQAERDEAQHLVDVNAGPKQPRPLVENSHT